MKSLLVSLLIFLVLLLGFHLGVVSTIRVLQTRYPKTWLTMEYEMEYKKRAEAARDKEE